MNQGSHAFRMMKFLDFSRTFPGPNLIFQGPSRTKTTINTHKYSFPIPSNRFSLLLHKQGKQWFNGTYHCKWLCYIRVREHCFQCIGQAVARRKWIITRDHFQPPNCFCMKLVINMGIWFHVTNTWWWWIAPTGTDRWFWSHVWGYITCLWHEFTLLC